MQLIKGQRYHGTPLKLEHRNEFTSGDWIPRGMNWNTGRRRKLRSMTAPLNMIWKRLADENDNTIYYTIPEEKD
jgi:hypothetical protein